MPSQGETYEKTFIYQDSSRTAINLTGYTARMQVRENHNSTSTILELTTENGGITITALDGQIDLLVADSVTSAVTVPRGVYDLELITADSKVKKFIRGTVRFPEEVTK